MRKFWIAPLTLALATVAAARPALAQAATATDASWAALTPNDSDWAVRVIHSLFPVAGTTTGTGIGSGTTAIQLIVGQFTGFVAAIACAFVAYSVVMHIHRAAESSRVLGQGQSWMFVVRVGFAAIMMFPINGGFSAGQALVVQAALTGVGMAKAVYNNAIQAIGPDAVVIAQPMIPGTQSIVAGLIDNELCMNLVNLAANAKGDKPLVPVPTPVSTTVGTGVYDPETLAEVKDPSASTANATYRYALSTDNGWGNPVCGTVNVQGSAQNQQTIAGVQVDMTATQKTVLNNLLTNSIRAPVAQVARDLWLSKKASALSPMKDIYTNAVNQYTAALTSAATGVGKALNDALKSNAAAYRNGSNDLLKGQVQQSTLGWTAAGAYYLAIAKMNATTLSLLSVTPVVTPPTYDGLPESISIDMAPFVLMAKDFMTTLSYIVASQDLSSQPTGAPWTLSDAKSASDGQSVLTAVFGQLGFTNAILTTITSAISPTENMWTDPFGGLMRLGQILINTALTALGMAALLSSSTVTTGTTIVQIFTFNWLGAAATVAAHAVVSFLGVPIFAGILSLLVPGMIIAYVLPMIPYVMWMAGVAGWIILVCEAIIAVPLWMLAHMTVGGDGLHGRATEGWSLLFNIVFRPTLMVIGLFLSYFVFTCMSWLIRQTFGVAVGFVLQNGWLVSNLIGLGTLLSIFVGLHITAALMSFRMIALLPHHLPKLIGFTSANRVDMDDFQQRAAWGPGAVASNQTNAALAKGAKSFAERPSRLARTEPGRIAGPKGNSSGSRVMDSTLQAVTDSGPAEDKE